MYVFISMNYYKEIMIADPGVVDNRDPRGAIAENATSYLMAQTVRRNGNRFIART